MNWFSPLFGIAIALSGQDAFAKNRLTDPIKIARECKSDVELLCKGLRPGGQRIISCLKEKVTELSPAIVPVSLCTPTPPHRHTGQSVFSTRAHGLAFAMLQSSLRCMELTELQRSFATSWLCRVHVTGK